MRVRVAGSPRAAVCLTWARSHGLAAGDRVRAARELARACVKRNACLWSSGSSSEGRLGEEKGVLSGAVTSSVDLKFESARQNAIMFSNCHVPITTLTLFNLLLDPRFGLLP